MYQFVPLLRGRKVTLAFSILLTLSILWEPAILLAQSAGPETPLQNQHTFAFTGNYCSVQGGTSLIDNPTGQISIDVPGTPVAAFWFWSGRRKVDNGANLPGDDTIDVAANGATAQTITATIAETTLDTPTNLRWYSYFYQDTNLAFVTQGTNTYTVSGLAVPSNPGRPSEDHGAGILVLYEDTANCPLGDTQINFGADIFFWKRSGVLGPNSEVSCFTFEAAGVPRALKFNMYIAGVADAERGNAIWYYSGTGSTPTRIAPTPKGDAPLAGADMIGDPFNGSPGREFDFYEQTIEVPAGTTFTCFQLESPQGSGDLPDMGISANWFGQVMNWSFPTGSLGDRVWEDANANGLQDGGELGVPNVTVNLFDGDSNPLTTTTTNASGNYLFDNLPQGSYIVEFVAPTGRNFTGQNSGSDDAIDSDADVTTGRTATITLGAAEDNLTVDAGLLPSGLVLASLGDKVWEDTNANGVQDTGEPDVPGVTVNLLDAQGNQLNTTTTSATGIYGFTGLDPDVDYIVEFVAPAGRTFTSQNSGSDDALDSDANVTTGRTALINLAPGENNLTLDAGLLPPVVPPASLGDRVWEDLNANGVQDSGEPGIASVTVNLLDGQGNGVATTTTDNTGFYTFTNLTPGDYIVEFVTPGGYSPSPQNTGTNDAVDSDADPTTGRTAVVSLASGESNPTVDAGFYQLAALGDFVWRDLNANGIQDTGEPGVAGITVNLLDGQGAQLDTTTTDASGLYQFANLTPGNYIVEFVIPTGTQVTSQNQGTNDAIDSDANPTTGRTAVVNLESGEEDPTIDAGLIQRASLGDRVWEDTNSNGLQDDGEPGVPGVIVRLLDAQSGEIAFTTTNGSGGYSFTDLAPATYRVVFVPPGGRVFTSQNAGDDTIDSDVDPTTGEPVSVTLAAGENNPTIDAGLLPVTASLGDFVWEDLNNNGIQEPGEPGVADVTVVLWAGNDSGPVSRVLTDTTDANGNYGFDVLLPGAVYFVQFIAPDGRAITSQDVDTDDDFDSDADPTTGFTSPIILDPNEDDPTIDAGLIQAASLGDRIWEDTNANGLQDAGETGVPGVTVNLWVDDNGDGQPDRQIDTMTTDDSGTYLFANLDPNQTYIVQFVAPPNRIFTTQNAGDDATDSDANPSTGITGPITLTPGETNLTVDAGLLPPPASLGNYVWEDHNNNGIQDLGEPGVSGVTVVLWAGGETTGPVTRVLTDTTDASGFYGFTDLEPGTVYFVQFIAPSGRIVTRQNSGTDDATDSDAEPVTGITAPVVLGVGENNDTIDAGLILTASIGDLVWEDTNGNGVQDIGELGVSDVTINLWTDDNGDGQPDTQITTTTTTGAGVYLFEDLDPNRIYMIEFLAPDGRTFTTPNVPPDDTTDSDANNSGITGPISLDPGENNMTIDAGLLPVGASVGDRVWLDANSDGIQDAGENGIPGIPVSLRDGGGTIVTTTTTGPNGIYLFTGLLPGGYTVEVDATSLPASFFQTFELDNSLDGSTSFTLTAGQAKRDVDFGYNTEAQLGSIGDRVWLDQNGDGVQDPGESGIPGVIVILRDGNGNIITTATTDADGIYTFANLPPADYSVAIDPTTLPDAVRQTFELDGSLDGSTAVTLAEGENRTDVDFGYQPLGSIGDRVWQDTDGDGVQEPGEPGIPGVTVTLRDSDGNIISTTTTDNNGNYTFPDLPPGSYTVEIDPATLPPGVRQTFELDGTPNGSTSVTLDPGQTIDEVDFGYQPTGSIGDRVWLDEDRDGLQDAGEPGVAGVAVTLYDGNGTIVATTTTDDNGNYLFTELDAGQYTVGFDLPGDHEFTNNDQGTDDALDSDANPATGRTTAIILAQDENNMTVDAGLVPITAIGDRVWLDVNANGIQNDGEAGLPDVTATLYDISGTAVSTVTTDASGNYAFTNLDPGSYSVGFTPPTGYGFSDQDQGADDTIDSDANPLTGRTELSVLEAGEFDRSWDAGLFAPPVLNVSKVAAQPAVAPGDIISYTIAYSNTGIGGAAGVIIRDILPLNSIFREDLSPGGWECLFNNSTNRTECEFTIGDLAAGGSGSVLFIIQVGLPLPPEVNTIDNLVNILDDGTRGSGPGGQNEDTTTTPVVGTSLPTVDEPLNERVYLPVVGK